MTRTDDEVELNAKSLNMRESNCGPLSDTSSSGIPHLANMPVSFIMTTLPVVPGRYTSRYRE